MDGESKQRQRKHRQIMNAILNYKRTPEQIKMLDQIKSTTEMEIDLRFNTCPHNHTYQFPYFHNSFDEEEQPRHEGQATTFDLHTQAPLVKKSVSTKTLSLDPTRRVKSLEREQAPDVANVLSRTKRRNLQLGRVPEPGEYAGRKSSLRDGKSKHASAVKLPELKKLAYFRKNNLEEVVGRKILTETSSPDSKRLAKYMKNAEQSSKATFKADRGKRFFLQQC